MTQHISLEDLSAFIDGELAPDELRRISSHLDACDDCRAEYESLKWTVETTRSLPRARIPAGASFRIPVDEPLPARKTAGPSLLTWLVIGSVAAVMVAAIGTTLVWEAGMESPERVGRLAMGSSPQAEGSALEAAGSSSESREAWTESQQDLEEPELPAAALVAATDPLPAPSIVAMAPEEEAQGSGYMAGAEIQPEDEAAPTEEPWPEIGGGGGDLDDMIRAKRTAAANEASSAAVETAAEATSLVVDTAESVALSGAADEVADEAAAETVEEAAAEEAEEAAAEVAGETVEEAAAEEAEEAEPPPAADAYPGPAGRSATSPTLAATERKASVEYGEAATFPARPSTATDSQASPSIAEGIAEPTQPPELTPTADEEQQSPQALDGATRTLGWTPTTAATAAALLVLVALSLVYILRRRYRS